VTVASLGAHGTVRQHLLWVALALSLALNLCFVAGALWIRIYGPPPPINAEERLQRIGAQLGLDAQQKEAFEQYSQAVRTRMQLMHKAVDPLIGNAWSEVAKPDADEAKVVQLFDEAAQARRSFMRELAPTTLSFLATLSPEQRAKFVELIRQRPWEQRHPHGSP
jgi:Spy/CpxP family protein refolding chaperone